MNPFFHNPWALQALSFFPDHSLDSTARGIVTRWMTGPQSSAFYQETVDQLDACDRKHNPHLFGRTQSSEFAVFIK